MKKSLCRTLSFLCVLALLLTIVPITALAGGDVILPADDFADDSVDFAVLSTTDMHGKCWDTNVLTDGTEANNMLKVKTAVNQIRSQIKDVFLIDNGDLYQGTPVSSVQLNRFTQGLSEDPLAMAVCLADIGYDASVLGNHEFNYSWQTMQDARAYLEDQGVSTVCANLYMEDTGENAFIPYITKNIKVGTKIFTIGILGLESTDCTRWDIPDNYPGIIFHHPDNPECSIAWEVNHYVPLMKAKGCDFIIVSYHGGTGSSTGELDFGVNTESQATRMIRETTGIDMVIAGHDHSASYSNTYIKNKDGKDVLIVNGGGTQLTKSVFTATLNSNGKFSVDVKSTQNITLSSYASDADLKAKIKPYADMASEYVNQEAGKCIGTWDKETNFYLKQSDSMDLIQAAQIYAGSKYIAQKYDTPEKQAALFEETGLDHLDIDLSSTSVVVNGSYYVKAGSMTMKDIYRLYKYDNNLYVLPMTGTQIKAVLEQNASTRLKATVKDGKVSYTTIGENFTNPVFGGLNFTYDMYQPEGSRVIIEGFANGRSFDPEKTYLVAVNNYHLGNVGCGFGAYTTTNAIWSQTDDMGGGVVQDLIMDYLTDMTKEKGGVDPASFNWTWKLDYSGDPGEEQGLTGSIIAKEVTELYDGQKIMIYSAAADGVMSMEPAANAARLDAVPATISGKYLGTNEPAAILTVVEIPTPGAGPEEPMYYAFATESGNYLTSGETGNSLGFSADLTSLGMWYLEDADGGFHIRNCGAAYNGNYNQALEWYTGFTTYGVQNTAAFLFSIYEPVETAKLTDKVVDGGRYVIYFDAEGTCLSTDELNGGLAPVTNTCLAGQILLPVASNTLIVTAHFDPNGNILFETDDGLFLTAPATGNGLSLIGEPQDNDLSAWNLVEVDGGWHIMNVGAAYNGNHNQAIEFYSGKFTTYGVQNTGIYLYNFYALGEGEIVPPCEHENTEICDTKEPTCVNPGYSGDTRCVDCGELLEQGEMIAALGHDWDEGVPEPNAAPGVCPLDQEHIILYTCLRCGATKNETVPAMGCPSKEFSDIGDVTVWYHSAADFVIDAGIMGSTSTEGKSFEPMTKVSRSMVASILYRIAGEGEVLPYQGTFTDVAEGVWYTNAIEWCAKNGLASGKGEGIFDPNGNVTRQELAMFFYNLAKFQGKDTETLADIDSFPDGDTVPDWAKTALSWCVNEGIISGKQIEDTAYLKPLDTAMRCELASILMRFLAE